MGSLTPKQGIELPGRKSSYSGAVMLEKELDPSPAAYQLCDLGHVDLTSLNFVSSSVKWANNTHFSGLLGD